MNQRTIRKMLRQRNAPRQVVPQNQRRKSTVLSASRKRMIEEFKLTWIRNHPTESRIGHQITMKTRVWSTFLFQHLSALDKKITRADVERWVSKHDWITMPGAIPKGLQNLVEDHATSGGFYNEAISAVVNTTPMESEETLTLPFYPGCRQQLHRQMPIFERHIPMPPPANSDLITEDNDDDDDDNDDNRRLLCQTPLQKVITSVLNDENQHEELMDPLKTDVDLRRVSMSISSDELEDETGLDLRIANENDTDKCRKRVILDRYFASTEGTENREESSLTANNNNPNSNDDNTLEGDQNTTNNNNVEHQEEDVQQGSPNLGRNSDVSGEESHPQLRIIGTTSLQPGPTTGPSTSKSNRSGPLPPNGNTSQSNFQPGSAPPNPTASSVPTPCRNGPQVRNVNYNQWNPRPGQFPNDFNAPWNPPQVPNGYQGKLQAVSYILTFIAVRIFILFVMVSFHHTLKLAPGIFHEGSMRQPPTGLFPSFNQCFAPYAMGMHNWPIASGLTPEILLNVLRQPVLNNQAMGMGGNASNNIDPHDCNHPIPPQQPPTAPTSQTVPPPSTAGAGIAEQPNMTSGTSRQPPDLLTIIRGVNLNDPMFANPFVTPAEMSARINLVVESVAAVCQEIPGLKAAVPRLHSFVAPINREMKKQMFPHNYKAARETAITEMKQDEHEEICIDSDTEN